MRNDRKGEKNNHPYFFRSEKIRIQRGSEGNGASSSFRLPKEKITAFRRVVWKHFRTQGRHALPWRTTRDPYRILVSEVMLQQTQVERVLAYYGAWMKQFPTVHALAKAPLSRVLRAWQGLGYNRRAKLLHDAATTIVKAGTFPKRVEEIEALPGVGHYSARAVAAFAYNTSVVFIETNIRTVFTHHFFPGKREVSDAELLPLIRAALPKGRAREWYSALMDYGAYLKRRGVRLNARAKGYRRQTRFEGSRRQARGAILKALVQGPRRGAFLQELMGASRRAQMREALAHLTQEGIIVLARGRFSLPN